MMSACCLHHHCVRAAGRSQVTHRSDFHPLNEEIGRIGFLSPTLNLKFSMVPGRPCRGQGRQKLLTVAALRPPSGKGFGKKVEKPKQTLKEFPSDEDFPSDEVEVEDEDDDDVVPEVVTNRMLKRIGLTVGVPMAFGISLFPLFYYLKVVTKLDVPEWLPLIVSLFTFGTAGFGITYGVVSTSWDPAREGSFWGWKEAQVNWPLIWQKVKKK